MILSEHYITADTDLRLCKLLGLSNGYWLWAQATYDTEILNTRRAVDGDRVRAVIKPKQNNGSWTDINNDDTADEAETGTDPKKPTDNICRLFTF